ncbi:hypothetical protein ACEQ8H_005892 [Pleosporales sp. CAS-2024a]
MSDPKAQEEEATTQQQQEFEFRTATPDDMPALQQLISDSMRALGKGYYTDAQLDGSIGYLFGPDSLLIYDDGREDVIVCPNGEGVRVVHMLKD